MKPEDLEVGDFVWIVDRLRELEAVEVRRVFKRVAEVVTRPVDIDGAPAVGDKWGIRREDVTILQSDSPEIRAEYRKRTLRKRLNR